jgi:diacylglycerol kinase (ATP)
MVRIGVISNPLSQRNKRGMARVDTLLAQHPEILHRRLDRFEDLGTAVSEFVVADLDVIAVNGGDGTVQATLTELFKATEADKLPTLAILSGGMTNMIAADCGLTGSAVSGLKHLIKIASNDTLSKHVVSRQIIRLEWGAGSGPIFGMFFGAAGIYRAIQICRDKVHSLGFESSAAVGLTLAGVLLRWLLPGRHASEVFQGDDVSVVLDDDAPVTRSYFLLIVTTLDRLILRSRPYWGQQQGGLRFTGVTFPPARLIRSILSLLYGGDQRKLPPDSYFSHSADKIRLDLTGTFTLDGEMYQPLPGRPVELSSAGSIDLVKY